MNPEDLLALLDGRQIHEEDFVEPALPEQLRREGVDRVGRGHAEDERLLVLEPGEKRAEDARRGAGVGPSGALDAGEGLFDLVHPEHGRGDGLGHLERAAHVVLGGAHQAAEDARQVKPQQRKSPRAGDRLGREALAAALDAEEKQALRGRQAVLARSGLERAGAALEPRLEHVQAADRPEVLRGLVIFEQAGFLDDLAFLVPDVLRVVLVELCVPDDRLEEDALRLVERQSERGVGDTLILALRQADLDARVAADGLDNLLQESVQHRHVRQRHVEEVDRRLQVGWDLLDRREDHDGLVGALDALIEVAESPHDGRIVHVAMEVLQ